MDCKEEAGETGLLQPQRYFLHQAREASSRSGQVKFRLGRQVIQATYERILAQSNLEPANQKMPTAKCLDVLDLHIVLYGS